jgi:hypothetical protein
VSIFVNKAQLQARGWHVKRVFARYSHAYELLAVVGPWLMASAYVPRGRKPDYYEGLVEAPAAVRGGAADKLLVGGDFNGAGDHGMLNALMEGQLGLRPTIRPPIWTRSNPERLLINWSKSMPSRCSMISATIMC